MNKNCLIALLVLVLELIIISPTITTANKTSVSKCFKQRKENHFFKVLVTIIANENFECLSLREQRQVLNSFQRLMNESYAE
jgi:hypothetical protein